MHVTSNSRRSHREISYMTRLARQFLCINVIAFLVSLQTAAQAPTAISSDKTSKIDSSITAFKSRLSIPSISVAIVTNNQIIFRRGYGLVDLENKVPATADTVYRI